MIDPCTHDSVSEATDFEAAASVVVIDVDDEDVSKNDEPTDLDGSDY